MSEFTELRARLLRQAAGLDSYHDAQTCARAVRECLGAALAVEYELDGPARCFPRPDGGSRIVLPLLRDEQVEGLVELHEQAHAVCQMPFPRPPHIHTLRASIRELSFRDLWKQMRETEAGQFVLATLLPAHLVRELRSDSDCQDVLEVTGLDRDTLQRRLGQVRGWDPELPGDPPPWSAWRHYRLEWVASPVCPRICAVPHHRLSPILEFPTPPEAWPAVLRRLAAELAALTETEFRLKYAGLATPPAEDVDLHWWEFAGVPRKWRGSARKRSA